MYRYTEQVFNGTNLHPSPSLSLSVSFVDNDQTLYNKLLLEITFSQHFLLISTDNYTQYVIIIIIII